MNTIMDQKKMPALSTLLKKQYTFEELFQAVPQKILELIATVLLCAFAAFPLLTAINSSLKPLLFAGLPDLLAANYFVGFSGLLMGIFMIPWWHFHHNNIPLKGRLRGNGLPLFLFLLLIWSCISCALSSDFELSFWGINARRDGLISYFSYAGTFILATQVKSKNSLKWILNIFTAVASIIALVGFLNIEALSTFLHMTPQEGIFYNTNHYGYYLCMSIPAAAWLFLNCKVTGCLLYVLEIAVMANGMAKNHSLGPFLATVLALLALLILCIIRDRKAVIRILIIIIIFAVSIGISAHGNWDIVGDLTRTSGETGTIAQAMSGDPVSEDELSIIEHSGSGRGKLWIHAFQFVKDKPVFGYGPDNLATAYAKVDCRGSRPHNEVLQIAASLGIPAALFYLCGIFCLLLLFIRNFKKVSASEIGISCIAGSYFFSSLFGVSMFYTIPFYFMFLGLCYSQLKETDYAP